MGPRDRPQGHGTGRARARTGCFASDFWRGLPSRRPRKKLFVHSQELSSTAHDPCTASACTNSFRRDSRNNARRLKKRRSIALALAPGHHASHGMWLQTTPWSLGSTLPMARLRVSEVPGDGHAANDRPFPHMRKNGLVLLSPDIVDLPSLEPRMTYHTVMMACTLVGVHRAVHL